MSTVRAADDALRLQLDLFRLDANARARVIKILGGLQKELIAKLANENITEYGKRRAELLLKQSEETIDRYYADAEADAAKITSGVPKVVAKATAQSLSGSVEANVSIGLPTETMLNSIASDVVIQGAAQSAWWAKMSADTAWKFSTAVRQGMVGGETNQQIIGRVRQVMEVSRSNAAALVQTSVQTIANDARMATFEANSDLIKSLRSVTALDSHVCEQCAALADKEWEIDSGDAPLYPLHFNCRCVLVPQMKIDLGLPEGKRTSSDGPVAASTTFKDFLSRQTKEFQDEALGPGRADLWRDGKITLQDLVNGNGRPLTLEALQKKYG